MLALLAGIAMIQEQMPSTQKTGLLADYEKLQYGMFIHYGMSTFTQIEIPTKPGKLEDYHPAQIDVDQWIRTAKEAGMKYAVLTTKHCYGHCLWSSKATSFTVANNANKTDVVRLFVDACKRHGLKAGFYYLLGWDSMHQLKMRPEDYEQFCREQVTELLTDYGPILEMWFDISWDMGPDTQAVLHRMYDLVKSLQPSCLVMFSQSCNVMNGVSDPFALTNATYFYKETGKKTRPWPSDITNAERSAPPQGHNPKVTVEGQSYYIPMEVCDTLPRNWFWVKNDGPRPLRQLVRLWHASVGHGANLLLDVPPDSAGRIPEADVMQLAALREAVKKNWQPVDYAKGRPVKASNVYHGDLQYSPEKAVDGNDSTRWATDESEKQAWLEVDLGTARRIGSAYVTEAYDRIRKFQIEVWINGTWKSIYEGGPVRDGVEATFKTVVTSRVRLHVTDSTGGPTVWSFELGP
ncbi:MAG: alpha-L-fucosidase [Fimbriimonadales bacterium]